MSSTLTQQRRTISERMLGHPPPTLWCPPLTHYRDDGSLDRDRTRAHWRHMRPYVSSFLVPGSTGEGWDMTEEDARDVLGLALELAAELKTLVLVGVLRTDIDAMCEAMGTTMATLHARSGTSDALKTLEMNRVAGFAVCPPSGASLAQAEIEAGLSRVLSLGLPTALYQLPQITKNEMAPLTVERLAG